MTKAIQRGKYGRYLGNILTLTDFIAVNIVFLLSTVLTPDFVSDRSRTVWLLVSVAYIPAAYLTKRIHNVRAITMEDVLLYSFRTIAVHALFFILLLYFLQFDNIPWRCFVVFYGLCVIIMPAWWSICRLIIKNIRKSGRNYSRAVIIGTATTARRLYREIENEAGFGYKVMGFFSGHCPVDFPWPELYLGDLDNLERYVEEMKIDDIFYTMSGENEEAIQTTLKASTDNVANLYYVPQMSRYFNKTLQLDSIGSIPVLAVRNTPLSSLRNRMFKRAFDLAFSSFFLVLSPIIFIPIAIAIKVTSPGPVFFRQKRTGHKGSEFTCLKFRTMRVNTESDTLQASRNDPRKTRLGDFLRRTSLDELPQFINVFTGDMSVVGPRPHMLKHTEDYRKLIDKYMMRHEIKPGITGWAQINGLRGQTRELWQMEKRVEYDVWYIENWSVFLDIKIISRTVLNAFFNDKNAF